MKRPLDDSDTLAVRPGAFKPLPQLSTARTLEALAAGNGAGLGVAPGPHAAPIPVRPVMCKFFLRNMCAKGRSCPFSHEINDMQEVPIEQKARSICKFFEMGQCNRGGACKFAHGEQELERVLSMPKRKKDSAMADDPDGIIEGEPQDSLSASLQAASGFQSFDAFDLAAGGRTEVVAGGTEDRREPECELVASGEAPSADDDLWNSFLAEVGADDVGGQPAPSEKPAESVKSDRPVLDIQSGSSSASSAPPPVKAVLRVEIPAPIRITVADPALSKVGKGAPVSTISISKGGKVSKGDSGDGWSVAWPNKGGKGKWMGGKGAWKDGSVWQGGQEFTWPGGNNLQPGSLQPGTLQITPPNPWAALQLAQSQMGVHQVGTDAAQFQQRQPLPAAQPVGRIS